MYDTSLRSVTAEIESLLVQKLSVKGLDLNQKIKNAGRALPKSVRVHAQYLIEAEARYQNPKRAHQYDPHRVLEARKHCVSHLEKMDTRRLKSYRRTAVLVCIVVNLFVLAIVTAILIQQVGLP